MVQNPEGKIKIILENVETSDDPVSKDEANNILFLFIVYYFASFEWPVCLVLWLHNVCGKTTKISTKTSFQIKKLKLDEILYYIFN